MRALPLDIGITQPQPLPLESHGTAGVRPAEGQVPLAPLGQYSAKPVFGAAAATRGSSRLQQLQVGQAGGPEWVRLNRFDPMANGDIMALVKQRVREAVQAQRIGAGPAPVVVFDLDETLLTNTSRVLTIFYEWLETLQGTRIDPALYEKLARAATVKVFGTWELFVMADLDPQDPQVAPIYQQFVDFFKRAFFDPQSLHDDRPISGAVEFVNELRDLGASIVYLTGRDAATLGPTTEAVLAARGFPIGDERAVLICKHDPKLRDAEFKAAAKDEVERHGRVVAAFDNEPGNVVVFARQWPEAVTCFVDTLKSPAPAALVDGLYRMDAFAP